MPSTSGTTLMSSRPNMLTVPEPPVAEGPEPHPGTTSRECISDTRKTVTMKRFRCYYCDSEFDVHKDAVHHLIEHHESLTIKYRELELNEKTCRQGY
ncbi:hypothetical protein DPMN_098876 [Dreissena polymorpha]|uniref:Uncharacterized protein n=1 Tax=Dreissena polymorpha TaxID=45954 RepID=A0A9D4R7P8_DREPO|nr:hypothetical protein DPMN_098876 [Dreissena polymorpha]